MKNYDIFYNKLISFEHNEAIIDGDKRYTYGHIINRIRYYEDLLIKNKVPNDSLVSIYGNTGFETICMFLCLCKNLHTIIPISEISKNKKEEFLETSTAD